MLQKPPAAPAGGGVLTQEEIVHIVFVAPEAYPVPPARGNSVEIYIWHLARQLAKNHRVTVISRAAPGLTRREAEDGVHHIRIRPGPAAIYARRAAAALRGLGADLCQVENRPLFLPVLKTACKGALVLNLHSMNFMPPTPVVRQALRQADAVLANSRYVHGVLRRRFPEAASRAHVLHPGADAERFSPRWSRAGQEGRRRLRALWGAGEDPVVLYVGRVIPRKGVDVLLRAMRLVRKRHPRARLVVAGGAWTRGAKPYHRYLAALARPLGRSVRALGAVRHQRLPDVYAAADCLVCPSQEPEALGLVNLEAMSTGLPVVASGAWGIPEAVKDGETGLLVRRYRLPGALAAAVGRLLDRPETGQQWGRNGRRLIEDYFNWTRVGTDAERIYAAVLNGRARRQRNGDKRGHTRSGDRHPDHGEDTPEHTEDPLP